MKTYLFSSGWFVLHINSIGSFLTLFSLLSLWHLDNGWVGEGEHGEFSLSVLLIPFPATITLLHIYQMIELVQNLPSITSVLWSVELMFRFRALFFIALGEKSAGCVWGGLWDKFSSLLLLLPIMCSALALLCSLISGSEDILLKYHFQYQRRNWRRTQTSRIVLSYIEWPPSSTTGWPWHREEGRWGRWTKRPRRVCPCSCRGGWGLAVLTALSAAVVEIWSDFVLEPTESTHF